MNEIEKSRLSMNLVHNERTKLTATWVNAVAVAVVATGAIAPVAAVAFGLPTLGTISTGFLPSITAAWLLLGITLHISARVVLRRLRE
jgi:VIT1/CCC1 family predicted Fe2+/Mn2+ transporter